MSDEAMIPTNPDINESGNREREYEGEHITTNNDRIVTPNLSVDSSKNTKESSNQRHSPSPQPIDEFLKSHTSNKTVDTETRNSGVPVPSAYSDTKASTTIQNNNQSLEEWLNDSQSTEQLNNNETSIESLQHTNGFDKILNGIVAEEEATVEQSLCLESPEVMVSENHIIGECTENNNNNKNNGDQHDAYTESNHDKDQGRNKVEAEVDVEVEDKIVPEGTVLNNGNGSFLAQAEQIDIEDNAEPFEVSHSNVKPEDEYTTTLQKTQEEPKLSIDESSSGENDSDSESEYEDRGSEASEEYDDEEDEEEEEDPPLLKYTRLNLLPKPFFNKELISASLINETFMAFGTSSGLLYVTDSEFRHLGTIRARKSPILSIHTDGSHIIAASMDGTVAITLLSSINNATNTTAYDLKIPLYSVVFRGQYKDSKSFIYATKSGSIVSSTLNWLGNRQERTLWKSPSESPVVKLEIVKNVLVWLGDDGIGFLNLKTEKVLKIIKRPKSSPKAELILPKINFIEHDRIIIGWVNNIWSIKIEETAIAHSFDHLNDNQSHNGSGFKFSSAMSTFSKNPLEVNITTEYQFKIEDGGFIGGIGSFKDDSILVLVLNETNGKILSPPELRIINYFNKEEISSDEIVLKDYQLLKVNDFQLGQCNHSRVFLMCSTDGIVADEYSLRDRFNWYVSKGRLLQAYEISKFLISKRERATLGIRQVEAYIDDGNSYNWDNATKFLERVINDSFDLETNNDVCTDLWDQWSWIYIKNKKFLHLAHILPVDPVKNLVSPNVYDSVLNEFISNKDQVNFHKYVQLWDLPFYHVQDILARLENLLEVEPDLHIFERCIAEIYLKLNQPKDAIGHFIMLKDPIVLELLSRYHLIAYFAKDIPTIIRFQITAEELETLPIKKTEHRIIKILDLLVDNRHELEPSTVIEIMNSSNLKIITFLYLKHVSKIDPLLTEPFETTIIHLYTEFDTASLLKFLKNHRHYNIDEAIETLKQKSLYKELVYLLGRVGQNREAMFLLIHEMDDADQAIDFARDQNSPELWDIFIEHGITKPNFIKVIIQYTGILFESSILKRIPEGVEIEGLQPSLVRIMKDNHCNLVIQESILKILETEGVEYCDLFNELRLRGRVVEDGLEIFQHYGEVEVNHKGELIGIGDYF